MAVPAPPSQRSRRSVAAEPPRLAVALDYHWPQADAPKVVASGRGDVADRIVAVAMAEGVPVRSDADLVQVLSGIEIGQHIPLEAFAAVAEILAYLYRLNGTHSPGQTAGSAPRRTGGPVASSGPNPEEHLR